MKTNWEEIGLKVGSLDGNQNIELGSDAFAKKALEEILGEKWIHETVNFVISGNRGEELAMNCLRLINSKKATEIAYKIYSESEPEKAVQAVWLIKHISHPVAFQWIEGFLKDQNVMQWGLGVLDQLLWTEAINYEENKAKIEELFLLATQNSNPVLKENVEFIKDYLKERRD